MRGYRLGSIDSVTVLHTLAVREKYGMIMVMYRFVLFIEFRGGVGGVKKFLGFDQCNARTLIDVGQVNPYNYSHFCI